MPKVLIADDDPVQRQLLEGVLTRLGHQAESVVDGEEALARLSQNPRPDILLLDLDMPRRDGMSVLHEMRERNIEVPTIVQTAQGGLETVVRAVRGGAQDFFVKPVGPERLQVSIANALKSGALSSEIRRMKGRQSGNLTFSDVLMNSANMLEAMRMAERAAGSDIPVLLEGESGVGKEIVAQAIHGSSSRSDKPIVAVNCGALPEQLIESILFGHEKGAFTGATEARAGKFAEADGGTLFLDEIGELPLDAQVKLLRVLQEGEVDPVGGTKPRKIDVRIVSATNRSLEAMIAEGTFREDLYYRLNVFPVRIPPLRERRADIIPLARHFLARFAAQEGRRVTRIRPDTLAMLEDYDWPGNVRQLENALFRAVVLTQGEALTPDDFPQLVGDGQRRGLTLGHEVVQLHPQPSPEPAQPAGHSLPAVADDGEMRPIVDMEADMIRLAIEFYDGRMTQVARRLGIGRSTLYRRLKELGISATEEAIAS